MHVLDIFLSVLFIQPELFGYRGHCIHNDRKNVGYPQMQRIRDETKTYEQDHSAHILRIASKRIWSG